MTDILPSDTATAPATATAPGGRPPAPAAGEPPALPFHRPGPLEPAPEYARMRAGCPVAPVRLPSGDRAYLAASYEAARTVLSDPRFSRAATTRPGAPRVGPAPQTFPSLLNMDPPEHTRVRRIISREFTARRVEALRPLIQQHTDALLDRLDTRNPPVDLVPEFTLRLPVLVICDLLGVPSSDQDRFAAFSSGWLSTGAGSAEEMLAAQAGLRGYLVELVAAKRERPGDDLLSALVAVGDAEDGRLSEEELLFLGVSLLVNGHETTAKQIANGLLALLTHPRGKDWAAQGPEVLNRTVEELLRLYPPGDEGLLRIALEDVELDGTRIPAGSAVLPGIGSANRDGCPFPRPEQLDPERPANPHLTFGHGAHYCLGGSLARAELQIALGSLLRRFPGLRLTVPLAEIPRAAGLLVHGVSALPVTW
ncbi:cytochrome P450 [Kitasatospora indigofera]|uniref:cytochrome P450 n=1 Tax=Kitasatospora indigofera TaxID=67307 RepID=UPI0036BE1D7B